METSIVTKNKNDSKFSVAISTPAYQKLINNTLGEPDRAKRFVAAITSAVAVNPALQECDAGTVLSAALLGESLNLSPSPQLGQFYMIPFNDKKKGKVAQFILGYKGMIQLAIRTGQYKKLNVTEIKEGELIKFDPLNEEIEVKLIEDFEKREAAKTIGYYAMFEYINGFRKAIYWSYDMMLAHADRYSPAFSKDGTEVKTSSGKVKKVSYADYLAGKISEGTEWLYSSFWYKNFDDMAKKTMIRQIISKWGIMSTEMQTALQREDMIDLSEDNVSVVDVGENEDEAALNEVNAFIGTTAETTESGEENGAEQQKLL